MEYYTVGYIANTHGLKGDLKIKVQSDFIEERFAKDAVLYLELEENQYQELVVAQARLQKGMVVVRFKGYDDINQVEIWKGKRLVIDQEHRSPLSEDEIYYQDLLKMQVQDENGKQLGEVCEILETGAHAIIRVKGEKEILIPYVKAFIKEVRLDERVLIVHILDGML